MSIGYARTLLRTGAPSPAWLACGMSANTSGGGMCFTTARAVLVDGLTYRTVVSLVAARASAAARAVGLLVGRCWSATWSVCVVWCSFDGPSNIALQPTSGASPAVAQSTSAARDCR
jgi:hypothetical protein